MDFEASTAFTSTVSAINQIKTRSKSIAPVESVESRHGSQPSAIDDILFRPSVQTESKSIDQLSNNATDMACKQSCDELQTDPNESAKIDALHFSKVHAYFGKDSLKKLTVDANDTINRLNSFLTSSNAKNRTKSTTGPTDANQAAEPTSNQKISCIIHGNRVHIDQADYTSFIKGGKWCASAFFQYNTEGWLCFNWPSHDNRLKMSFFFAKQNRYRKTLRILQDEMQHNH
jgi:hypothetical protein